jgi:hypothetical protein
MKHMPQLTADQQQLLDAIGDFLRRPGPGLFLLKGYAGTGKTFLLGQLCRQLEAENQNFMLMAPTGRAAWVLSQKTGFWAATIHRNIYNLSCYEFDENQVRIHFSRKCLDAGPEQSLAIADEASMIANLDQRSETLRFGTGLLLDDLMHFLNLAERGAKAILAGDPGQLPPVGMNFSPALDAAWLRERYGLPVEEGLLNQVVRQAEGSGVLAFAGLLREAQERPAAGRPPLPALPGLARCTPESIPEAFLRSFDPDAAAPSAAVVCASNRLALAYNRAIREVRWGEPDLPPQPGDWLIIAQNHYGDEVQLLNGEPVRVLWADDKTEEEPIAFKLKGGSSARVSLRFRTLRLRKPEGKGLEYDAKILDSFLLSPAGALDPLAQRALFIHFKQRHPGWRPDGPLAAETLIQDPYFSALRVKYGYALTCHKAQGGEWPQVWADMHTPWGGRSLLFFRWAYTAATRAREHLTLARWESEAAAHLPAFRPVGELQRLPPRFYYLPPAPPEPGDPPQFAQFPFLKRRWLDVSASAPARGIEAAPPQHLLWAERYALARGPERATLDLRYGAQGFSAVQVLPGASPALAAEAQEWLATPLLHPLPEPALEGPRLDLWELIRSLADEERFLTGYEFQPYKDQYFLRLPGCLASLSFHYDGQGRFSTVEAAATDPASAALAQWLEQLRARWAGTEAPES